MPKCNYFSSALLALTAASLTGTVFAQDDGDDEEVIEELIVTGTQIRGADIQGTLPVSVLSTSDIVATGATDGQELLRAIPQIGETNFNESVTTGVNAARGDVGSINLRGLGTGNTLVLINGRRMVLHPGTQTESFVPVVTANSNTLPVRGLARVEVLRDGASALYGTDAVAGVVNYILRDDYEGFELNLNYGAEADTDFNQTVIDGAAGFNFNGGATNLTVTASYSTRDGIMASEKSFSANADSRPRVANDPLFAGDTQLDGRSTATNWGQFDFDNGLGRLHVRPINLTTDSGGSLGPADCSFLMNDTNLCLDGGSGDRALRLNRNAARTLISDRDRTNVFAFLNHEFGNAVEFVGEAGYYHAVSDRVWEQASNLSNGRFEVPADYYWNPLGPVNFDDGRLNPNRLPGLDPLVVPVEGVGFLLRSFRPLDAGPRRVQVTNDSYRLLAGLRGGVGDWDWDTAVLYSEAETEDVSNDRLSSTLFQQQLLLDTPDAYNVFTGGDITDPTAPNNPNPNPQSAIDPMQISVTRNSRTSLTLVDFKMSNGALFEMPAGSAGIGLGLEYREEDFVEDRDPRSDGSISFTDAITGQLVNVSDMVGSSASPDARGERRVTSAYVELLLPLLSDAPLARSLDLQLAARHENFSDVGDITRPRIVASWYPIDSLQVRASYSEGFRAPNLVQIHQGALSVVNTRSDPALADPVTGAIPSYQIQEIRIGNRQLEPEESENTSFGFVLTPTDGLVFTLDFWQIKQDGVVGIFGGQNHVLLDDVLRDMGSSNPAVQREVLPPGGGLGMVEIVFDRYLNFQPRTIEGYDFSINYGVDTGIGAFDIKLNAARLLTFDQQAGPLQQILVEAGVPAQNVGDLVQSEFRPKWRATLLTTWTNGNWGAGLSAGYVGEVFDTQTRADGDTASPGAPLPVDAYTRVNIYGDYIFETGATTETSVRIGIRNLFDEDPPLADEAFGYEGSLHSWMGQYVYANVNVRF